MTLKRNEGARHNIAGCLYAIDIFAGGQAGWDKYGSWFFEGGFGLPGGNLQRINVKAPWVWPCLRNNNNCE